MNGLYARRSSSIFFLVTMKNLIYENIKILCIRVYSLHLEVQFKKKLNRYWETSA